MERVIRFAYKELARYFKIMTGDEANIRLSVDMSLREKDMDAYLDDKYEISVRGGA